MVCKTPYCWVCEGASAPSSLFSGPGDAVEVYNAVVSLFSVDRTILDMGSDQISRLLVRRGFLHREPNSADLEAALDLVAAVES
jgi:hypothetical protein